ncbi:ATP-binding protein [Streptomyces sp. NPDC001953]
MSTQLEALPYRHVLTLPTEPSAVRIARETAEQALVEWRIGLRHPTVDPALLILSELVTNSVRHAASLSPQVTVIYAASPDCLAIAVHDRHPYQPPLYGAVTGAAGGGLATVMELVLALGGTAVVRADADGRGKSI